jgi:hypothetical protein
MAAGARVKPVGNIDCSVGTDRDVGGTEPRFQIVRAQLAALGIDAGKILGLVAGEKVEALELVARAFRLREIAEDDVSDVSASSTPRHFPPKASPSMTMPVSALLP